MGPLKVEGRLASESREIACRCSRWCESNRDLAREEIDCAMVNMKLLCFFLHTSYTIDKHVTYIS